MGSNTSAVQKQKDADKASAAAGKKRQTAGELRMQKGVTRAFSLTSACKLQAWTWEHSRGNSWSADMAELHISDIGRCVFHEEGKLMDFDIYVVPQGGIYKCVPLQQKVPS